MTEKSGTFRGGAALAAGAVGLLLSTPFGLQAALAAGPFDGLNGLWSGSGTLTFSSGTKEALRCRVQYVQNAETNITQALRCASDSYRFEINAYFASNNGGLTGNWAELTQEISGTVSGTVTGGQIVGSLHGPGFVAQLSVLTNGNRQTVSIQADLEEIESVAIEVRKAQN
jgi:hypothetical protein